MFGLKTNKWNIKMFAFDMMYDQYFDKYPSNVKVPFSYGYGLCGGFNGKQSFVGAKAIIYNRRLMLRVNNCRHLRTFALAELDGEFFKEGKANLSPRIGLGMNAFILGKRTPNLYIRYALQVTYHLDVNNQNANQVFTELKIGFGIDSHRKMKYRNN